MRSGSTTKKLTTSIFTLCKPFYLAQPRGTRAVAVLVSLAAGALLRSAGAERRWGRHANDVDKPGRRRGC
jgi:hypothetical protein